MRYTPQTKKAMELAYQYHHGQRDKGGAPYVFHPFHLAEQMDTETEVTAALLHDVVEDTPCTFEDLRQAGISEEVLEVLDLLTHPKGMPYLQYIERLLPNATARKIKLADMRHNSDFTRLPEADGEKARYFAEKYAPALRLLQRAEENDK
jgi:(p)ppGpp synthase/HD superfamily hydrolase